MSTADTATGTTADPVLACGNCRRPMRRLDLEGHYGGRVALDLCRDCDLVWFDDIEGARLSGPGVLALIGAMVEAHGLPHEMLRANCVCPRCGGPLRVVHDQTHWGKLVQLQCLSREGAYQSFAEFLEGKGLLRPMTRLDRAQLLQSKGRVDCVNCGAALGTADEVCPYCRSVPSLLDVARLAHALDPQGITDPKQPVFAAAAAQSAMHCAACGAALPPGQTLSCPQCHATLAIDDLDAAYDSVKSMAGALREAEAHPSPEVVKRRLEALDADLPAQRAWVEDMKRLERDERDDEPERASDLWRWVLLAVGILAVFASQTWERWAR